MSSPFADEMYTAGAHCRLSVCLLSVEGWGEFRVRGSFVRGTKPCEGPNQPTPTTNHQPPTANCRPCPQPHVACWSPTRPGLLFLGDAAGTLHVWDLIDRTHEPALKISAASGAITSLAINTAPPPAAAALSALGAGGTHATQQAGGGGGGQHQLLAVGDAAGVLHFMVLPRTLRRPLPGEVKLMEEFVRREGARLAEVAARQVGSGSFWCERLKSSDVRGCRPFVSLQLDPTALQPSLTTTPTTSHHLQPPPAAGAPGGPQGL